MRLTDEIFPPETCNLRSSGSQTMISEGPCTVARHTRLSEMSADLRHI